MLRRSTVLGELYSVGGAGVAKDNKKAMYWYEMAAVEEHAEAIIALSQLMLTLGLIGTAAVIGIGL